MTIEQLRRFIMVVRCGSIAKAAVVCGVTPQAVSKSVGKLECEIGRCLFARTSNCVKLTSFGMGFCMRAALLVREFDRLEKFALSQGARKVDSQLPLSCAQ